MSRNNGMIGHIHHQQRGIPCWFMILQDETCARFAGTQTEIAHHLHQPEDLDSIPGDTALAAYEATFGSLSSVERESGGA